MTNKEAVDLYRHAYKKANDTQEGIDELTLALNSADKAVEAVSDTESKGLSRNEKIALVGGGGALTAGLAALLYGLKKKKQKPVKK